MAVTLFRSAVQSDTYKKDKGALAELAKDSSQQLVVSSQIGRNGFLHSQQRSRIDISRLEGNKTVSNSFDSHGQRASYQANGSSIDRLAAASSNRVAKGHNKSIFVDSFAHSSQRKSLDLSKLAVSLAVVSSKSMSKQ